MSLVGKKNKRNGQALVEAMVALSVLLTGFLGAMTLLSQSIKYNRVVTNNYIGTYLAEEGIEVVKNIIDTNIIQGKAWNAGLADGVFEMDYSSTGLQPAANRSIMFDPASEIYSYSGSIATPFRRQIRIALIGSNEVQVNSIVTWSTGLAQSQINLEDHFLNWR